MWTGARVARKASRGPDDDEADRANESMGQPIRRARRPSGRVPARGLPAPARAGGATAREAGGRPPERRRHARQLAAGETGAPLEGMPAGHGVGVVWDDQRGSPAGPTLSVGPPHDALAPAEVVAATAPTCSGLGRSRRERHPVGGLRRGWHPLQHLGVPGRDPSHPSRRWSTHVAMSAPCQWPSESKRVRGWGPAADGADPRPRADSSAAAEAVDARRGLCRRHGRARAHRGGSDPDRPVPADRAGRVDDARGGRFPELLLVHRQPIPDGELLQPSPVWLHLARVSRIDTAGFIALSRVSLISGPRRASPVGPAWPLRWPPSPTSGRVVGPPTPA